MDWSWPLLIISKDINSCLEISLADALQVASGIAQNFNNAVNFSYLEQRLNEPRTLAKK